MRSTWRCGVGVWLLVACSHEKVHLGGTQSAAAGTGPANPETALINVAGRNAQPPLVLPMLAPMPAPTGLGAVLKSETPPPPISGGTLAVTSDGSLAVAADPDRDAVHLVDLRTQRTQTLPFPRGSEPGRAVLDDLGNAHVALRSGAAIARIELANARIAETKTICQYPRGLALDRTRGELIVACASGELVQLDPKTYTERARSSLPLDLRDVVVKPSGARFVTRYRSAELLALDDSGALATRTAPPQLKLSVAGGAATSPQDNTHMSPTQAWRTLQGPDGTTWMLHQRSLDDNIDVSAGGYARLGRCGAVTRPTLTTFDAGGQPAHSMQLGSLATLVVDLALSPDGRWLAYADPAAYLQDTTTTRVVDVGVLQTEGSLDPRISPPSDGGVPGLHCSSRPESGVAAQRQTTAVAFDAAGLLYIQTREPATLQVARIGQTDSGSHALALLQDITLSERSARDTGHDLFHTDVGSGLSCASCHGEALDDGHVWRFNLIGPRRTQNFRGGFQQTLPLHWKGDLGDIATLVADVMTVRMGGFIVQPDQVQALADWMEQLPPLKLTPRDAAQTAAAARGKALFESSELECANCHSGEALTNNETVNVGTNESFQVPSLRGLALRAPYMHDGCAAELEDRFDPECGGTQHGRTAQLSPDQLQDLIVYLKTL